jgi:hypothetical protein
MDEFDLRRIADNFTLTTAAALINDMGKAAS